MSLKLKKYLDNNAPGYEVHKTIEGGEILFVPRVVAEKVTKYLKRFHVHLRSEWRGSYTWLAIYMD